MLTNISIYAENVMDAATISESNTVQGSAKPAENSGFFIFCSNDAVQRKPLTYPKFRGILRENISPNLTAYLQPKSRPRFAIHFSEKQACRSERKGLFCLS